jgi:hypothetical protein
LELGIGTAKTISIAYQWKTGYYSTEVASTLGNRVIEYWFARG